MDADYRVELKNISKSFSGIPVLRNVNFNVRPGEIHALVGENGAGKSTLMKILSGATRKDEGKIILDGNEVAIRDPRDSRKLGIGIIYQELSIISDLSVAENICLHRLADQGFWMKWGEIRNSTNKLTESLGFKLDPSLRAGSLGIAQQQMVEIAKALSENLRVLILDEPTSVLGPNETGRLFEILRKLKEEGVAIIYISHRLEEIFSLCDRVTVLKDGVSSGCFLLGEIDHDRIIQLMLGRSPDTMFPHRDFAVGEEVLIVLNIRTANKVSDVSFSVHTGEVFGIAGLVGSGRTETMRAVFGADKRTNGKVFLRGVEQDRNSPTGSVKAGLFLVPEDRVAQGIIPSLSIRHNISLADLKRISNRLGFINAEKESDYVNRLIEKLDIRTASQNLAARKLSGGNQQKVALAKWFSRNGSVIIVDEPTRGIDVGAKVEIYRLINELAGKGMAVIVVSSESAELTGICDRIMVMHEGKVQGLLDKPEFSEENILKLSIGKNINFESK